MVSKATTSERALRERPGLKQATTICALSLSLSPLLPASSSLSLPLLTSFMLSTATMSSPLSSPHLGFPTIDTSSGLTVRVGRQRSSSLLKVEKVGENSQEEDLDENVYDNVNAEWVNRKGKVPLFIPHRCRVSLSLPLSPRPHTQSPSALLRSSTHLAILTIEQFFNAAFPFSFRRMANASNSHLCGKDHRRYYPRDETGD